MTSLPIIVIFEYQGYNKIQARPNSLILARRLKAKIASAVKITI